MGKISLATKLKIFIVFLWWVAIYPIYFILMKLKYDGWVFVIYASGAILGILGYKLFGWIDRKFGGESDDEEKKRKKKTKGRNK